MRIRAHGIPFLLLPLLALVGCQGSAASHAGAPTADFDSAPVGRLPEHWRIGSTGAVSKAATWLVQPDATAPSAPNTLALTATNHDAQDAFNLCWNEAVKFGDGWVGVAMRADGGEVDQGGGLAWRVQDEGNYYVCRFNPLEANFRVYVVKGGVRRQLATALVPGDGKGWHQMAVEHRGAHITCWLDGRKLLQANDDTFAAPGGVGFWTKADARTSFDNLVVDVGR